MGAEIDDSIKIWQKPKPQTQYSDPFFARADMQKWGGKTK